MLDKVKLAIRVSTDKLDSDLQQIIDAARAELARAGVLETKAQTDGDPLIDRAIITYARMESTTDMDKRERFALSFAYQADNLRKSRGYGYD